MNEAPVLADAAAEPLDRTALVNDLADRDRLADLGEVVGPVTHEFNNFLNTLMLQVAVMEMTVPEAVKAELRGMKRQAKQVAAVVKHLQQYRRRVGTAPPADLSRAAACAVEAIERAPGRPAGGPRIRRAGAATADDVPVRLNLAAGLPLVSGPAADLQRMCRFLLGSAAWVVAGNGSLTLMTMPAAGGVVLRLEAAGAAAGSLARLLDGPVASEGAHGLEFAASQSVVRRLGGSIRAEPIPDGEAVVIELPAAPGE
jgi:C4-dicarboxylate-specific signal transduction histidine kinase